MTDVVTELGRWLSDEDDDGGLTRDIWTVLRCARDEIVGLRSRVVEFETYLELRAGALKEGASAARNRTLEEAARECERVGGHTCDPAAAAIRALKIRLD